MANIIIKKSHNDNLPMQYTANFSGCKDDNFHLKMIDSVLVFGQKINCGYTLEQRRF